MDKIVDGLLDFIECSPSPFHTVKAAKELLEAEDFQELSLEGEWKLRAGGRYFVEAYGSTLLAFRVGKKEQRGLRMAAAHTDFPCFRVKPAPALCREGYGSLNVECYGGLILSTWQDRPLSLAGKVVLRGADAFSPKTVLVDFGRPLMTIPSLAIHMNRDANNGVPFNPQKELLPLYGDENAKGTFMEQMAALAGVARKDILAHDLYVYSRTPGTVWGASGEYISCGRLDDLQCAFSSLEGFLQAQDGESIPLHCVFDNEEVGSSSKQGAASTLLRDTLIRICEAMGKNQSTYRRYLANSFMISADNAHAVHPNYTDKACPTNRPYMNGGIVIKYSANQKYTTDGMAAGIFQEICKRADVPYQTFLNRSDMAGGSTLGNISNTQVALNTVDIGLPQLAMHSPYETAGSEDTGYLIRAAAYFFESSICESGYGSYTIKHI